MGPVADTVSLAGLGTYEVDGDTVTWLGGECEVDAEGVYTYTLEMGSSPKHSKMTHASPAGWRMPT